MTPISVTATLRGAIVDRSKSLMLDALLTHAVAMRDGLEPLAIDHRGPAWLEIPIARSECGRVWLCSQGIAADEDHELRYKQQRFPLAEAQMFGAPQLRRVNMSSGPSRSYRIPMDTVHLRDDEIRWYAIGDATAVETLLVGWVGYLGHRRAVGLGQVAHWHVETMAGTWDGFPVARDGLPLRPLPTDWPGLSEEAERAYRCLAPPYWRRAEEEPCVVPAWA